MIPQRSNSSHSMRTNASTETTEAQVCALAQYTWNLSRETVWLGTNYGLHSTVIYTKVQGFMLPKCARSRAPGARCAKGPRAVEHDHGVNLATISREHIKVSENEIREDG